MNFSACLRTLSPVSINLEYMVPTAVMRKMRYIIVLASCQSLSFKEVVKLAVSGQIFNVFIFLFAGRRRYN